MIPVCHGEPSVKLVLWIEMWESRNGIGYNARLGNGWRVYLKPFGRNGWRWGLWKVPGDRKPDWGQDWYTGFGEVKGKKWWLEGVDGASRLLVFRSGVSPEKKMELLEEGIRVPEVAVYHVLGAWDEGD